MASSSSIPWPILDEAYTDEFGVILPKVYRAAGELWPQAEGYIHSKIGDVHVGLRLMIKAAASVSRLCLENPNQIRTLKGYLWTTFIHLVREEQEKEGRYPPMEPGMESSADPRLTSEDITNGILYQEAISLMNPWMRKVWELRVLDHKFEEIARILNMRPNALRSKYDKELKKLRRRLKA
jgi:DNA-directed RNA polymerase specialized sigma24 family protein